MTAEIEGFISDACAKRGIDPAIGLRVARSEGGVDEYAAVGKFPTGWSWWPYQLHYGGAGYEQYGTTAGMGTGFTKLTGWPPGAEMAWRDSCRYALNRAKASGWGAWYGAAYVGISQWEGIDQAFPWDANAESWDYERPPVDPVLRYNPGQPPERQVQDWTCSIRSTAWVLKSLGLPVDIGDLQDEMCPRYVTPDIGLLDGRGYGIAEVLKAHLPATWDSRVQVFERIGWEDLWDRAGQGPFALGLHGAYHWINVATTLPDGSLAAPNPAPKYPQAAPIGDVLLQDEFTYYGPASAVWVDATLAPAPSPPGEPTDPYAPWRGLVGSGLLDAMALDATTPAQAKSTWLPLGQSPADIEECFGMNGTAYRWHIPSGSLWKDRPGS